MAALETTATIRDLRWITPTVFELKFALDGSVGFTFTAGQWLSVVVPGAGSGGKDLRRAYSIASPPERLPEIDLCIKIVEKGPGTQYLSTRKPGDQIRLFGPYGMFIYKTKPGRGACFVATGTGISPFHSMVNSKAYAEQSPARAHCLLGVREETEILYRNEIGARPGIHWVETVSRPSPGAQVKFIGRVTDWLKSDEAEAISWRETDFYLCGNSAMIDEVKKWLMAEKGVEKTAIHQEIYYRD